MLEVWKREPRARLTLRLNRLSSAAPEIFYVAFPLPTGETLPRLSSGGQPFTPFTDQLPGTCRDYFAIDGWADYATPDGHWLWVSRDAPLVTFGASPTLARRDGAAEGRRTACWPCSSTISGTPTSPPTNTASWSSSSTWYGRPGSGGRIAEVAETLTCEPVALIHPGTQEDPRVLQHLFQP